MRTGLTAVCGRVRGWAARTGIPRTVFGRRVLVIEIMEVLAELSGAGTEAIKRPVPRAMAMRGSQGNSTRLSAQTVG